MAGAYCLLRADASHTRHALGQGRESLAVILKHVGWEAVTQDGTRLTQRDMPENLAEGWLASSAWSCGAGTTGERMSQAEGRAAAEA
jgi:hypothetical protein